MRPLLFGNRRIDVRSLWGFLTEREIHRLSSFFAVARKYGLGWIGQVILIGWKYSATLTVKLNYAPNKNFNFLSATVVSMIVLGFCCLDSLFICWCISNISRSENQPFFMIVLTWSTSLWLVIWNLAHSSQISVILFLYLLFEGLLLKYQWSASLSFSLVDFFMLMALVCVVRYYYDYNHLFVMPPWTTSLFTIFSHQPWKEKKKNLFSEHIYY